MTNRTIESVELALFNSVAQANLEGLVGDIAETALDAMTNDEFVSSIPVFNFVSKLYNGVVALRDQIFLHKVHSFLCVLKEVPQKKRAKFMEELEADAGTRAKAGQALILLLDRLDSLEKPQLIGRAYRARLEGTISFDEMRRFSAVIDRGFLQDL